MKRADIDSLVNQMQAIIFEELTKALAFLGEQSVATARDRSQEDSWYDQTGNLRSSIGFAVFAEGKATLESAFKAVTGPKGDGAEGTAKGRQYLESFAEKYADTLALVVVAGMDYASYVEAKANKDVLATAELQARGKAQGYLQQALDKAIRRINKLKL